jgi:predicted ATPase
MIELKYREQPKTPIITYHLEIQEGPRGPQVASEWLQWRRGEKGKPFRFLEYHNGQGRAVSGEAPDEEGERVEIPLKSPDLIAVNALGQFADHPRVAALRDFITDWYVSYLSIDDTRSQPEAGPQERLNKTGDNLANVIQYLRERHSDRLDHIFELLRLRIPRLDRVLAEPMPDGRLLLQIKDAPFEQPILSRLVSDGTLKMLAYLVVLNDPEPPQFVGIEEPENFLHPRLLPGLAEECRRATDHSQLLVTTHSPFLLDAVKAEEVQILYRDSDGYTRAERAADLRGVKEFLRAGASMGHLWLEGYFGLGDPLVNAGAPAPHRGSRRQ